MEQDSSRKIGIMVYNNNDVPTAKFVTYFGKGLLKKVSQIINITRQDHMWTYSPQNVTNTRVDLPDNYIVVKIRSIKHKDFIYILNNKRNYNLEKIEEDFEKEKIRWCISVASRIIIDGSTMYSRKVKLEYLLNRMTNNPTNIGGRIISLNKAFNYMYNQ